MSDHYQIFVPIDVRWQPSKEVANESVSFLKSIVSDADEITADFSDELDFQDPGGNWSGVECPSCRADIETWFCEVMTEKHATNYADLRVVTPCCNSAASLDALHFVWPASFFRFRLSVMNGRTALNDEQICTLESHLGSKVKLIWRRI